MRRCTGSSNAAEHADAVPDRRTDEHRRTTGLDAAQLTDLRTDRAVGVHHTFRVGGRARGVRDECRRRRVDGGRARHGVVGHQGGERKVGARITDHRDPFEIGKVGSHRVEVRDVVEVPERIGGHERLHTRARQDVQDFLRPVEVHDRHDDGTEVRDRVERRRRLQPVRQLHRDGVAGTDAARGSPVATRRASRSTSPNVPRNGARSDRTVNGSAAASCSPAASTLPSDWSFQ